MLLQPPFSFNYTCNFKGAPLHHRYLEAKCVLCLTRTETALKHLGLTPYGNQACDPPLEDWCFCLILFLHTAGKRSISLSKLHRSLFYLQAFYRCLLIPWPDVRTMMLLRLQREWSSCRRFRFHPSSHKPLFIYIKVHSSKLPFSTTYILHITISILGGIPAFLPFSTNHMAYLPPSERTPKSRILCLGVTAKVLVLLKPVLEQQLEFQS